MNMLAPGPMGESRQVDKSNTTDAEAQNPRRGRVLQTKALQGRGPSFGCAVCLNMFSARQLLNGLLSVIGDTLHFLT